MTKHCLASVLALLVSVACGGIAENDAGNGGSHTNKVKPGTAIRVTSCLPTGEKQTRCKVQKQCDAPELPPGVAMAVQALGSGLTVNFWVVGNPNLYMGTAASLCGEVEKHASLALPGNGMPVCIPLPSDGSPDYIGFGGCETGSEGYLLDLHAATECQTDAATFEASGKLCAEQ